MTLAARCLFLMITLIPAVARAEDPGWRIMTATGTVSVQLSGRTMPIRAGEAVPAGSAVLTGRDGRADIVRGGEQVSLLPGARLGFDGAARLFADRGKVIYALADGGAVATPFLVVKGEAKRFSVTVSAGGASVSPEEGAVDVATIDGALHRRIQPGMVALVGADERDQIIIDGAAHGIMRQTAATAGNSAVEMAALP